MKNILLSLSLFFTFISFGQFTNETTLIETVLNTLNTGDKQPLLKYLISKENFQKVFLDCNEENFGLASKYYIQHNKELLQNIKALTDTNRSFQLNKIFLRRIM